MTFIKDYVFVPMELEQEASMENGCPSEKEMQRQALVQQAQQKGGC